MEGSKLETPVLLLIGKPEIYTVMPVLISAVIALILAVIVNVPFSLSQALFGGLVGGAIFLNRVIPVNYILLVILSWVFIPILSILICFHLLQILNKSYIKGKLINTLFILKLLTIISTFYISYIFGANTLGFLHSLINYKLMLTPALITLAVFISMIFLGKKVEKTIGEEIYTIGMDTAFSSQAATATLIEVATQLGVPVSITQSITSGILGGTLTRELRIINKKKIFVIFIQWAVGPILSFIVSILLFIIFQPFF